jgi:exodeoxyribonuclease VII large subunit
MRLFIPFFLFFHSPFLRYISGMQILSIKEEQQDIYTISRLNSAARFLLENHFASVWVEGEVSNFAAPNSGHWYFSLKDTAAQVRCAMFRANQRHLDFLPKDGMHILIKARVSLYENRGEFQLIVENMEERGEGKLRRALEVLKKKLAAEGLFAPEHKKPIPLFPKQIGVITSATGAAIRDILHVLKRRFTAVPVIIYPSLVQGAQAAADVVNAIQLANQRQECDVLILARGGGSLEDLWPFNEEIVAKAIFASDLPIITGIGHEVDFTIADFVADKRAPTPSAAAEIATPDKSELLLAMRQHEQRIARQIQRKFAQMKEQLRWTTTHLRQQHPKRFLAEKMQHVDILSAKLTQLFTNILNKQQAQLANLAVQLDALSPLATLKRGYAIAIGPNQEILHNSKQVKVSDDIRVRLLEGEIRCVVKEVAPSTN